MSVALLATALAIDHAAATAGLAEWSLSTPGGLTVGAVDPWTAEHHTFIQSGPPDHTILVSRIEWWVFYEGHIAGAAKQSDRIRFFLLEEKSRRCSWFGTQGELEAALASSRIGAPIGERMTPADGWNAVWGPVIRKRCQELDRDQTLDAAIRAQLGTICRDFEKR
jgi:hypothetical protein